MRKFAVAAVAMTFLFAGNANASYTIDLIWSDTGTSTLTITEGDTANPAGASTCNAGRWFAGSGGGTGRCLEVVLTAASKWTAALVTLGWDSAASGLTNQYTAINSYGPPSLITAATPSSPVVAGIGDCSPSCDTAVGSFGGLGLGKNGKGTFTIGSINFDTTATLAGLHSILNFLRTGVDGMADANSLAAPVQINGATLNVNPIPEPGTAALLGVGIMGLVMAGRRRKA